MIERSQPLVTIAIPTYNRADSYLKQVLESAVNQTYQNIEIVVSDNCSVDDTETVVKGFSDPRIRYFKQTQNIGANNNYNFCLKRAQGDYFLLLHDDDMIDEDFIEVCMRTANYDTGIGLIRTGMRRIDAHGKVLTESPNLVGGLSTEDFFLGWFAGKTPMHLCCTLFDTKRLKEIGGFNSKYHLFDDVLAEVQLAARFGRVDVQDAKASFRRHPATRTFSHKITEWCEESLILLDTICDLVPDEKKVLFRREGMRFFAKHNYWLASKIKSPTDRFITYLLVFKKFDYQYSPLHFFIHQTLRRMLRLKGKVKQVLDSGVERTVAFIKTRLGVTA